MQIASPQDVAPRPSRVRILQIPSAFAVEPQRNRAPNFLSLNLQSITLQKRTIKS